jgi:hypothetical protein
MNMIGRITFSRKDVCARHEKNKREEKRTQGAL